MGEPDAALAAHANGSLGRDRLDVQRRRRAAQHVNHLIGDRVQIWPAFHGGGGGGSCSKVGVGPRIAAHAAEQRARLARWGHVLRVWRRASGHTACSPTP